MNTRKGWPRMKRIDKVLFALLLIMSLAANIALISRPREREVVEITHRDTIVEFRHSTDTIYLKNTIYRDRYHYDTLIVENTVYLKDTLHDYTFKEKEYDLDIRAMKLDSYKLDVHMRDTVRITETNTVTVKENKQRPFTIGVGVGYGVGMQSRQFEPFVGVSINYRIF